MSRAGRPGAISLRSVETKKPAWKGRGKKGAWADARADGNEKLDWKNVGAEYVAMRG